MNANSGSVTVRAYNTDKTLSRGSKTLGGNILLLDAYAKMSGIGAGYVASKTTVEGSWTNEIRSKVNNGGFNVHLNGRYVTKLAEDPEQKLDVLLNADCDKTFVAVNLGEFQNSLSYGNQNDLLTQVASTVGASMSASSDGPVKVLGGLFGASTENDTVCCCAAC